MHVNLSQTFTGQRDKIVTTLESVAAMLESEVRGRASRAAAIEAELAGAAPAGAATYLEICEVQLGRLTQLMRESEGSFARASSATGSPDDLRRAYATLLDGILSAREAFSSIDASRSLPRTQQGCRDFTRSMYDQFGAWPRQVATAAGAVKGTRYSFTLKVACDVSALEQAIARESKTLVPGG